MDRLVSATEGIVKLLTLCGAARIGRCGDYGEVQGLPVSDRGHRARGVAVSPFRAGKTAWPPPRYDATAPICRARRRAGPPRAGAVGDPPPLEVPQQPRRELPSADQGPGTGDETLRLA